MSKYPTEHLEALELALSHERQRLATAQFSAERELRSVWVAQLEKEITQEREFLGLPVSPLLEITDDELLAALNA